MGSYGIGLERAMAIVVETHHDQQGIIWPKSITPFQIHLIGLDDLGEDLYQKLTKNITVSYLMIAAMPLLAKNLPMLI